jgi:hypothetical protein
MTKVPQVAIDNRCGSILGGEPEKQWFAAAFHLGRLLLDAPDDPDLNRRAEELKKHAVAVPTAPGQIPLAK